jgi:diguanylate cyclase (GGDEF)-like protein
MKFNSKYSVVIVILLLLVVLSTVTTTINFLVSKNSTQEQLKKQALPLSLDNVYTEIQKHIIQPYLVSSMMANDTFVQDWILTNEQDSNKIKQYLSTIKNKYEMFTTFLVSENTKSYYTQDGFIEKLDVNNENNKWYFRFKNSETKDEINLDYNSKLTDGLIMFINYKIFDREYKYLGATGVGIKISYIDDLLEMFKQKYMFNVYFFNKSGKTVLAQRDKNKIENISQVEHFLENKDKILSKYSNFFEVEKGNETYLLNTKYISELDLYLLVEAKLSDFTNKARSLYYINLLISVFIALIITFIITFIIKKYNKQLEYLAEYDQLTNINNRRAFTQKINFMFLLNRRNNHKICIAFIDIDNFKNINDKYGHTIGDKVLIIVSSIMKNSIRSSDLIARWGGEEFIIALINSDIEDSKKIINNIREKLLNDLELKALLAEELTISTGLTSLKNDEGLDEIINRADNGMYKAKNSGKDTIVVI